jgi:serine/threonine protein kinase/Tfp pilus assembly protein PilF
MTPENWRKVESLLNAALEIEPRRRRKFLNEIDGDELRREVESLLAAEPEAEKFLASPAMAISADFFDEEGVTAIDAFINQKIGSYKILRELGRGGMGAVYLAERADGKFTQKVAVKLLKRELNTADIRRRFARERQILAALAHPNIARLLDAGTTGDGLPFLVMEYVEGLPVDDFCAARNPDLEERLQIFRTVCDAVAFAHRNLTVHRDLKPSNILVTGDGIPKLLDFGISKLLTPEFEAESANTVTKLGAMTPEYASPEQLRGESVTTATDVYSLGVILYELLTGQRPFEFKKHSAEEIIRAVCETEPPPPSAALNAERGARNAQLKRGSEITNQNKPITVPHFAFRIPRSGDLDNIVLKALRKEPARRYQSVEQFAEDIRRHLEGLPVAARPNTFRYRAEKFARRNRASVLAAAFVVLSLAAGLGAALWQANLARDKARIAAENQSKAETAAEKQKKITGFMERVLSYANPSWYAEGNKLKGQARVIDVLNDLSGKIETEFPDDLDIQAELHHKCAEIFLAIKILDRAERHARRALDLRRRVFGERHPEVAKDLYYLGEVLGNYGNIIEKQKLLEQAAGIFRETAPDNANLPHLLESLGHLKLLQIDDDYDRAEKLFAESLELFRRRDGDIHFNTARLYFQLSLAAAKKGEAARAEELFREGEIRIAQSPIADWRLHALHFRATLEKAKGNLAAAKAAFVQLIDESRKLKGANSDHERNVRNELVGIYERENDWAKAVEVGRMTVDDMKNQMPETSVGFGRVLAGLSIYLLRDGKREEAARHFERAYRIFQNNRQEAKATPDFFLNVGEYLLLVNRRAEALPILEDTCELYRTNYPPNFRARIRAENLLERARAE